MKKVPILPNVITAFGLSCGLFMIFKMTLIPSGKVTEQVLIFTAGLLLVAAIADVLDGAVARILKAESSFGGFFDSLADAITFGVGPSIIVLKSLSLEPGTELSFLLMTAAMVFSVCGVLRLVRYNVMAEQAKADEDLAISHKKYFTGLPIPAAAGAAVSGNLLLASNEFQSKISLSEETRAIILSLMLIILGYFMISRWKFPSVKSLHIRVSSFKAVFLTVISAVLLFYGILQHFALIFAVVTFGYVILAWILSIIRVISGRRLKTLEDFEPEPDDLED